MSPNTRVHARTDTRAHTHAHTLIHTRFSLLFTEMGYPTQRREKPIPYREEGE